VRTDAAVNGFTVALQCNNDVRYQKDHYVIVLRSSH